MSSRKCISTSGSGLEDRILKDKFFKEVIEVVERIKKHTRYGKYAFKQSVKDLVLEMYNKILNEEERKLFIRRLPK